MIAAILDSLDQIETYTLRVIKARLVLEGKGIRFKGPSTLSVIKKQYGYTGNRDAVIEKINQQLQSH